MKNAWKYRYSSEWEIIISVGQNIFQFIHMAAQFPKLGGRTQNQTLCVAWLEYLPLPICTNITAVKLWPGSWFSVSNRNGILSGESANVGRVNNAPGALFQTNPFRRGYSGKRSRIICELVQETHEKRERERKEEIERKNS